MPRPNSGPRLKWREDRAQWEIVWYERGIKRRKATGTQDRPDAEGQLEDFLRERRESSRPQGPRYPHQVTVADVLNFYGSEHAPGIASKALVGYSIDALLPFWAESTVDAIKGETCRAYYRQRRAALSEKYPSRAAKSLLSPVDGQGPSCFDNTIRRELATISAALEHCRKEGHLLNPPAVWLPPGRRAKERWLTRSEAAALIRAARREPKAKHHLPLFILIGLYMGQRKQAILDLQWIPNTQGGWVDLEHEVIHWKAEQERESTKQRPRSAIPPRLLRFLRYARRHTRQYVFERDLTEPGGKLSLAPLGNIAHGFASAACHAGMGTLEKVKRKRKQRDDKEVWESLPHAEITPHVLRHTCITWLLQRRVPVWEVAGFVGATEEIIRDCYGHHHPDHQATARNALNRS